MAHRRKSYLPGFPVAFSSPPAVCGVLHLCVVFSVRGAWRFACVRGAFSVRGGARFQLAICDSPNTATGLCRIPTCFHNCRADEVYHICGFDTMP